MSKRIYIAGKIGTYDIDKVSKETFKKFADAERELRAKYLNCHIYNPVDYAKHLSEDEVYYEHLQIHYGNITQSQRTRLIKNINIRMLTDSTAIYLLTDWRSSAGALFEKEVADFLGLEIIYQKERIEQ